MAVSRKYHCYMNLYFVISNAWSFQEWICRDEQYVHSGKVKQKNESTMKEWNLFYFSSFLSTKWPIWEPFFKAKSCSLLRKKIYFNCRLSFTLMLLSTWEEIISQKSTSYCISASIQLDSSTIFIRYIKKNTHSIAKSQGNKKGHNRSQN